jgi:hypothetical protein
MSPLPLAAAGAHPARPQAQHNNALVGADERRTHGVNTTRYTAPRCACTRELHAHCRARVRIIAAREPGEVALLQANRAARTSNAGAASSVARCCHCACTLLAARQPVVAAPPPLRLPRCLLAPRCAAVRSAAAATAPAVASGKLRRYQHAPFVTAAAKAQRATTTASCARCHGPAIHPQRTAALQHGAVR